MQLGTYKLKQKKNRIGYYLFHASIGILLLGAIQILYASYFIHKSLFIDGIQLLLIGLIGYTGGNYIMLRGNADKKKYIVRGLLIVGSTITVGILIGIILRVA